MSQPPAKQQPKTYILSFKTHKLTAVTCVPQADKVTIGDLKEEALSVLQAEVLRKSGDEDVNMDLGLVPDLDPNGEWEVPMVKSVDAFELSRAIKERGRPTGQYEVLSTKETVKQSLMNWESLFIQFRDENGEWSLILHHEVDRTSYRCVILNMVCLTTRTPPNTYGLQANSSL